MIQCVEKLPAENAVEVLKYSRTKFRDQEQLNYTTNKIAC